MKNISYKYDNLQIPGGGYVTGFCFHPAVPGILYARTDIGGCYRYDFGEDKWISLVEHVTHFDMSETFPLAIALDPKDPAVLYVASGMGHEKFGRYPNGYFTVSKDYGKTFTHISDFPCHVHGNAPGRGTGTRMLVDPVNSDIIWFASQEGGLIKSNDRGKSWETINVRASENDEAELNLSFVWVAPNGKTVVVAADGLGEKKTRTERKHSLYVSYNAGESWEELSEPSPREKNVSDVRGYVGHRYAFDGKYFYVTMNSTGPWSYIKSYSCDCGDVTDGRVVRYEVDENYHLSGMTDITPFLPEDMCTPESARTGFGGIGTTPELPGYVICSSLCSKTEDFIVVSEDYGNTWRKDLQGLHVGRMRFNASYMKPEYNGGGSLVHWFSDVKINPFNADQVFVNTGTGVFASLNHTKPDYFWSDHCKGIEETVHLNVYAPVCGSIIALDIVGDLGGFVFTELDNPCENSFADEKGDRYITSINADYPDTIPDVFVATPRGNWTGKTCGGVVYSDDAGKTLRHLSMPYGLSEKIDERLKEISRPNVNAGWVAISSDGKKLIWTLADGIMLPTDCVLYSDDLGDSWKRSKVISLPDSPAPKFLKPFFDRVNPSLAFGFGEDSRLYVSTDCGKSFYEKERPEILPVTLLSGIDAMCTVEIRGISGNTGSFIMAMGEPGLFRLDYSLENDRFTVEKLSKENDAVYCVGLGILPGTDEYINNDKALYVCATIDNVFGFYRSFDYGKTWEKINDESQMFGEIKSIDADKKVFGRYFIATGTRGLKYGEGI
ncbi:MAG: endoglucanase [Lachnospiraceae bacterium]|nr:endoglucanase [Lachnospiraceae bacterium]